MDPSTLPENPNRPPHWRWERASSLARDPMPDRSPLDDDWVGLAARMIHAIDLAGDDRGFAAVRRRWPMPYWAARMWQCRASAGADALTAHLVEAWILAGADDETVAEKVGLAHPDQARCYEQLFFDVREKPGGYVTRQVIGPAIYTGLRPGDYPLLWKLVAFHGGPLALERFVHAIDRDRPTTKDGVARFMAEILSDLIYGRGVTAGLSLHMTQQTALELMGASLKLVEIEAGNTSPDTPSWAPGMRAVLERSGVTVGRGNADRMVGGIERRPGKPLPLPAPDAPPPAFPAPRRNPEEPPA